MPTTGADQTPERAVAQPPARVVLALALLGAGLAAGFFFAYSVSVMRGLAIVDDATFVSSMQSINAEVRTAPFALVFFGTPFVVALALALELRRARRTFLAAALIGFAGLAYVGGVLVVTAVVNLPLNDDLALAGADLASARADFESEWTVANHIRTAASLAAFAALAAALAIARPRDLAEETPGSSASCSGEGRS